MSSRRIRPLGEPRSRISRSRSPNRSSQTIGRDRSSLANRRSGALDDAAAQGSSSPVLFPPIRQDSPPADDPVSAPSTTASSSSASRRATPPPITVTNIVEYPPDQSGFFRSTYFGDLPNMNPFWAEELKKGGSGGTDGYTRIRNTRHHLANTPNPSRAVPPLILFAGERLNEELQHDDDAVRVFAERVFFRNLRLSDEDIGNTVIQSRMERNTNMYTLWRGKILHWQKAFQNSMLSFILLGVKELIRTTGGLEKWLVSSGPERREVFIAYYEQDPKFNTWLFFKAVTPGVDLHGIFASQAPPRKNWQTFVKNIFVWTCEDTFELRIRSLDTQVNIGLMVSNFKQMAWDPKLLALRLGDIDKVPIHVLGVIDQQRRAKLLPVSVPGGAREVVDDE